MQLRATFILASQSPRRQDLLERMGLPFVVIPSHVEEMVPENLEPAGIVEELARQKVEPVSQQYPDALTLAADTIVVLDGDILGKPADAAEAQRLLRRLSGQTHTVFTGLALAHPATGRLTRTHEATDVTFGDLSDEEIAAYVATGSPLDKAGAYGIQDFGAVFVARIDGDFYNVMGLPLHRFYQLLRTDFADLLLT
jgi:septum formation protein